MIKIRESIREDKSIIEELSTLANANLRKVYRPTKETIANKDKLSEISTQLVATLNNRIVGTVRYMIKENSILMIGLCVHPDSQRTGIARKLIEEVENIGRDKKVRYISLYTIKETNNVPIFNCIGFETISEDYDQLCESDIFEKLTVVYMKKNI